MLRIHLHLLKGRSVIGWYTLTLLVGHIFPGLLLRNFAAQLPVPGAHGTVKHMVRQRRLGLVYEFTNIQKIFSGWQEFWGKGFWNVLS